MLAHHVGARCAPVGPCRVHRASLGLGLARTGGRQMRAIERAAHPRDVPGAHLALLLSRPGNRTPTCRNTLRAENGAPSSSRPYSLRSFQQCPCSSFSTTLYLVPCGGHVGWDCCHRCSAARWLGDVPPAPRRLHVSARDQTPGCLKSAEAKRRAIWRVVRDLRQRSSGHNSGTGRREGVCESPVSRVGSQRLEGILVALL